MDNFYQEDVKAITLHAAERYPTQKDELRAMTIAGFRIAQNSRQLDQREMRTDVLRFLQSPDAISWWKKKGWLEPKGRTNYVKLTSTGLATCSGSLHQETATNTQESLINSWEKSMLQGGPEASQSKSFTLPITKT
jgi:hypothetical protein